LNVIFSGEQVNDFDVAISAIRFFSASGRSGTGSLISSQNRRD
jgi:hypothetical protein